MAMKTPAGIAATAFNRIKDLRGQRETALNMAPEMIHAQFDKREAAVLDKLESAEAETLLASMLMTLPDPDDHSADNPPQGVKT